MVDQVIMGTEVRLLKQKSYWYLDQTPDDYIGWITRGSISRKSDSDFARWSNAEKYSLNINFDQVFTKPSKNSQVITDLVLGSVFIKKSVKGQWMEIELPDSRSGYVALRHIRPYEEADNTVLPRREAIVKTAMKMMGIPYLWGGHSTKAMDCSGFTGTVFRKEGYRLPRDANMQVKLGEEVIPDKEFSNILPGDLVFFGPPNRITHVGISLGGPLFIHESGDVHINSLDEKDELYNAYRKKTLRKIKRILKN
jgi:cell wall-associated NlpC family hydrolase